MELDIARLTDALTLSFGIGESGIGHLCNMFCRPNSIVMDVGANIGSTTLAFAEIVSQGQVHAFEPAADMRSVLLSNIQSSHFTNVAVYPFGLAEGYRAGHLQIAMQGNPGSAYFVPDQTGEVELWSLDEVMSSIHPVDFVKMDVEGYEKYVLIGGQQLLCHDKPAIVFEVSEPTLQRAGTCSQEVFDLLERWGYTLWGLKEGRFYEYVPQAHRTSSVHNVLALHPGNAWIWQILEDRWL
jgi:FkbM family methyltransferase